jgi:hypothetical protein
MIRGWLTLGRNCVHLEEFRQAAAKSCSLPYKVVEYMASDPPTDASEVGIVCQLYMKDEERVSRFQIVLDDVSPPRLLGSAAD